MSYWPTSRIQAQPNTPSIDSFARWRTSSPTNLFDYQSEYDVGPLFWDTTLVGAGTILHLPNESSVLLSTGSGTIGDSAARQTFEYFRYQPGKSQLAVMTGVLGVPKAGVRQRLGYFDARNGVFFEQTIAGLAVVVRTSTSGAPVDGPIPRALWQDKLDGTGPSGMNLNTANENIFWFDLEWLGAGQVRFGVWGPNGFPIVCYESQNANMLPAVYMTTANLPLRYEITNIAAAAGSTSMTQTCSSVVSEGGAEFERAYTFAASNGTTSIAVTTRRAILSIRPKALFNGIINRAKISPVAASVTAGTNMAFYELVYNPTFTGTPVWTSADSNSTVEYSIHGDGAAGAITGGIVIWADYAPAGSGVTRVVQNVAVTNKFPITLSAAGASPKALSIVCTSMTGTSNDTAALNWLEVR